MLHEAHRGPLAVLNITPHARYYGSITTSPLYPIVLWEFWRWTADSECVRRLIEPALRALHWLDTDADLDGDGFYEFQTRSEQGLKNQGWKDSSDAIVYADGTQVPTPIATCEAQAFAYAAKRHMAELLWWFGRRVEARELQRQALALRRRFHDVFWMEPEAFVAMALDPQKRPVRSIASDAGHCLGTGIFDPPQARAVADRLLAADLFSGWGIRTLSAAHPAFNPFSYQRGSVWPVENGLIALGLARYGLYDHLHRLCRAHFEAAALFDHWRLPEVFSGHPRDAQHPFPGLYPETNWPQAWSAAAVVSMLDALLGIWPFAPREVLVLDPHLPPWLPQLIVAGLRVGAARVTIEFRRRPDGATDHRVLEQHGSLRIVRRGTSMPDLGCSLEERATALAAL